MIVEFRIGLLSIHIFQHAFASDLFHPHTGNEMRWPFVLLKSILGLLNWAGNGSTCRGWVGSRDKKPLLIINHPGFFLYSIRPHVFKAFTDLKDMSRESSRSGICAMQMNSKMQDLTQALALEPLCGVPRAT